jgi:hypothetical protein
VISAKEAVDTLIAQCNGTYTVKQHSTTVRTFKPSYDKDQAGFNYDQQLNDKKLMPYVPHEWINN